MSQPISVIAYRHPKKEGMFLYLSQSMDWQKLPLELQDAFASKQEVIRFDFTPDKRLARVNAAVVYPTLQEQGYFVQMPPADINSLYAAEETWIAQKEASISL